MTLRAKLKTISTLLWLAKEAVLENKGCVVVVIGGLGLVAWAVYEFLMAQLRF